ncbi:MAG: transporter, partial [Pirellulales bacterium]
MSLMISTFDLAILFSYLMAVVLLGLWLGRGQRDVSDYLLGGRSLPWWAILLSIVATETSTVTFLSVPGIAYAQKTGNFQFLQLTFGYMLGR